MRDAGIFAMVLVGLMLWAAFKLAGSIRPTYRSALLAGLVVGKVAAGAAW